ncbi:hypothetical protein U9M48_018044 [Paspalum notatum var. saurae]|uniref:Uncharacterized protein n=1 Tax=Paspalum notatum var. saurae TaxID=547442 RepID=A0AAQ3T9V2_PASNO
MNLLIVLQEMYTIHPQLQESKRILHQPCPQGTKGSYVGDSISKNVGKGRQTCEYLKQQKRIHTVFERKQDRRNWQTVSTVHQAVGQVHVSVSRPFVRIIGTLEPEQKCLNRAAN